MSTRSRIAIENQDKTVSSIYCHNDGSEDGVGVTLKEHYTDREKVQSLINLGDISILGEQVSIEGGHSFNSPRRGITVAYHRDRGEVLSKAEVVASISDFESSDFEEYGRVFTLEGEWVTFS
jgi:hypothetical protein